MSAALKRMSDRGAKSGEDMLEVLADDLSRYELLSAVEAEEILREVEGHHPTVPISLEQEDDNFNETESHSVSDVNSASSERFVSVTSKDCDDFLLANVNKNTKYKTNSDINLFYMWARENSELRQIQDIPPADLDSLLARMYLGMYQHDLFFKLHVPFNLNIYFIQQSCQR